MITVEVVVCPVDGCRWQHVRVPPPVTDAMLPLLSVFGPRALRAAALATELEQATRATDEHMAEHTAAEFLATILRLQGLLEQVQIDASTEATSVTCPLCGRTSYHPRDVEYGYCGACRDYTSAGSRVVPGGESTT